MASVCRAGPLAGLSGGFLPACWVISALCTPLGGEGSVRAPRLQKGRQQLLTRLGLHRGLARLAGPQGGSWDPQRSAPASCPSRCERVRAWGGPCCPRGSLHQGWPVLPVCLSVMGLSTVLCSSLCPLNVKLGI